MAHHRFVWCNATQPLVHFLPRQSIMPQQDQIKTKETSRLIKLSNFWHKGDDVISTKATKANRCAVKAIKQTSNAWKRKGGTCMCGTHFLCPHHDCLPTKKRKLVIGDIPANEYSSFVISDDAVGDSESDGAFVGAEDGRFDDIYLRVFFPFLA
jgi:hypothetical protein